MKWGIWILAAAAVAAFGAEAVDVGEKFKHADKCRSCHNHIVNQWETSWHAKSHYDNDEYFRKTIDYLARKSRKSLNAYKIECAACHNPRISVTSTTAEYEAIAALKLDQDTQATKALKSDTISEGINCVVCHNIDQIQDDLPDTKRGIHRITWMKPGVMSGPYDDAKSPYHKVEKRDFMDTNADKLCLVCHANDTSEEGHRFTDMQSEYKSGGKQCVDCHMSERKMGVATTMRDANGQERKRLVRTHGFVGAHTEKMWEGVLDVSVRKGSKALEVILSNPLPHAIPSGFGSREIVIDAVYTVNGGQKHQSVSLTSRYETKRGKPTIPHLAAKTVEKFSIPSQGSRTVSVPLVEGADQVSVSVSYRLVNDEVRQMLDLQDSIWSRKALIKKITLKL